MATARSKVINADFGFKPRPWQAQFIAGSRGKRFSQVIASRQVGKSQICIVELVAAALSDQDKATHAYLCPFIAQARKVVWGRLKAFLEPIGKYCTFRESELSVQLPNGSRIILIGAENSDASRGLSIKSLVIDEMDNISTNDLQSVFIPAMNAYASHPDSFIRYIGTIGYGFSKLYAQHEVKKDDPDWYCQITPITDTDVMTEKQLERLRLEMGDSNYLREMCCDPHAPSSASIVGDLIITAEQQKRITFVPHVPQAPVITAWDLGIADSTSVWFVQLVGGAVNVIGYRDYNDLGLDEILLSIRSNLITGRYNFSTVILPNDVSNREGRSGETRLQMFEEMGFGDDHYVLGKPRIVDTIQSVRINLQRCRFDADNCADGIKLLKAAEFVVEERENMMTQKVRHDSASHAFDAFRYLCHWLETANPSLSGGIFTDYSKQKHNVIRSC